MKKIGLVFVIFLSLAFCLISTGCGQANSAPSSDQTVHSTPEQTTAVTFEPTPTLTPTPVPIDYEALAAQLNSDIISPVDEIEDMLTQEESKSEDSTKDPSSTDGNEIDIERLENSLRSGSVFEAGNNCLIYRLWSAGIDKEFIDLLGSDGTETSSIVYAELIKTFIANYDALQKAVALYEPDAIMVLHIVSNSESTDPLVVIENGEVTYDYASAQGYFVPKDGPVEETPVKEDATG